MFDELKGLIENNLAEEASDLLDEMIEKNEMVDKEYLLEILLKSKNPNLRNSIAFALSDLGVEEVVEPIITLLKSPETLGHRGSLLGALEPFNYVNHAELLVDYFLNGNYEVSRRSYSLLEPILDQITVKDKEKFARKIEEKIEDLEIELDFLKDTVELFESE
ncbi:HEAT repeat domain-containing protein [Lysinibacillus sp. NPDC092081]|uniref:HEAT repeat domain-containing protein n=1 Tax=Lysinibacillus sp. NPDC092081 TaxID=3364131 RepID=UPI003804FEAE